MESEEGPAAASSPPSPPPHPDASPVGSPDHALDDVHALLSDDDLDHVHDLGHGDDGVQEEDPAAGAGGGLTEHLKRKIIKQVEYYFSDENLPTDSHMMSWIKKNKEGFVPIGVIASFRKMKKLIRDNALVAAALKESEFLVVSSDETKVKRLAAVRDPKLYTVLVENLPEDHSVENLRRIFGEAGNIKHLCVRDPHATEESSKGDRAEKFLSCIKLHALVEYETVEAAEKAVASLNNEQDWRSGMHVKLLKRMAKRGQKKQTWRGPGPEPEKNHAGQLPDRTGDEGNHNSSEHHDDTPDEEAGPHLHKEKNEHRDRGRNRGRSGRQKHRGPNGHGTTWSGHSHEPPKPPPGPKMPDGTRGFTMGRGRPPISNQS